MSGSIWDESTFLDLTGYGISTAATPEQAYGIEQSQTATGNVTVALVLPRMNDPTTLLGEDWAQRESALNGLTPAQVGAEYGADPAQYDALTTYLKTVPGATLVPPSQGDVSSAPSRTVWVSLNAQAFQTLFNQTLLSPAQNSDFLYWDGTLTPNAALSTLAGLWVDSSEQPPATPQDTTPVTLTSGPQGIGNTAGGGYDGSSNTVPNQNLYPNRIAAEYDFPLATSGLATPTIGLVEPGVGTAVPAGDDPNQLIQQYRASAGITGTGTISDGPDQPAGTVPTEEERSLDVGVIAAAAPNSNIVADDGDGGLYATIEEAVWGGGTKLADLSSSFTFSISTAPGSPFAAALQGLYEDAALNNISYFEDAGDGGSSAKLATGLPLVDMSSVSPYVVSVGGTSISSQAQVAAAGSANTQGATNINAGIAALEQQAETGSVAALETLVTGGLTQDPTASSNIAAFLQTVWNGYVYDAATGTLTSPYDENYASAGGVDTAIPEPSYQTNAGIDTQALAQAAGTPGASSGKGDPDVSALSGGNSHYVVPGPDLTGTQTSGGTSASTPLWAALTAQIQAVFADEGLPTTGYFNDLLYIAAAVDPGAFDDVLFGSNTSTYYDNPDGTISQSNTNGDTSTITPTGLGYSAGPGYDLATGLGTPDGILLGRALTQIAEAEINDPNAAAVTDGTGETSAAAQALIVQPTLANGFSGAIGVGGASFTPASDGSGLGWSARIAEQSLQSSFAPALAQAIAGQAQASSEQITVAAGQSLAVTIGDADATPTAQQDTTPYGFVTDMAGDNAVTLARPLAVAETYGGQNDTDAIVRIRQDSTDADALTFYRVDDLDGDIGSLAPGQAGYVAAAAARAYTFANGGTSEAGPGAGQFAQTDITGVNDGDIIAVEMTDATSGQTTWGLASQNAGDANSLWSYGADTWGLDDGSAGGAGFTSLVFQLDFTSNAGHGLLAFDNGAFITGLADSTTDLQAPTEPFAGASVADPTAGATDSVTIALSGAAGTLAGSGLAANPDGTYALGAASPTTLSGELDALVFTPAPADGGPVETTTFDLTVTSSTGASASASVSSTIDSNPNMDLFGAVTHDVTSPGGDVYALYQTILGRAPDPVGDEGWVQALDDGTPLASIAQSFLASSEYANDYGATVSSDSGFVDQLYEDGLHRAPEPAGLAYWDNMLASGTSRAQVAADIATSPEAQSDLGPTFEAGVFVPDASDSAVARLYYGLLNRAPDATGFQNNAAGAQNGESIGASIETFLGSPEYAATPVGQDALAYVNYYYENALGRAGDPGQVAAYQTALDTGAASPAGVADTFFASQEFQSDEAGQSNAAYIDKVYQVALGRDPEPAGYAAWQAALAQGTSRVGVAEGIVASSEFAEKVTQPMQAAFVTALYEGALGRAPSSNEVQGWQSAFANGASVPSVAAGIVESQEATLNLAPRIEAGYHIA